MKGYIFSFILFFLSLQGMAQKVNEVKKKEFIKKETPRFQYQYRYDSPHCDIGVVYDKNCKAITYTYDSILTRRRSQKTNKQ
jgi:hypothetical protein